MKKIYDKTIINNYINNCVYKDFLKELSVDIFLIQYEVGEFIRSPFQNEMLFQVVVDGSLAIYFIRNDGTRYSLSSGGKDYIIGDMELFEQTDQTNNIYAEASEDLTCISFSIDKNKDLLLNNADFLRIISQSLSKKIQLLTTLDASPTSLTERVLCYMKYKCDYGTLKGIEQAAFQLHCSPRQLQRVLNQCEHENIVKKIGKGTYKLTK